MNTVLAPKAAKYLERLHEPMKGRIIAALKKLENEPPQGDVTPMTDREGFRLRVGKYRLLFGTKDNTIVVTDIDLRGQVYKGR